MIKLNKCSVTLMFFIGLSLFVRTRAYVTTYDIPEDNLHVSSDFIEVKFPDGSKLIRFYRPIGDECYEPKLHLKILHRNGTTSNFNIQNLSIPRLNFCKPQVIKSGANFDDNTYYDYIDTHS